MFEIKSSGNYWIDSNGNMWSKMIYSKEDALELSRTLKDCRGCLNPVDGENPLANKAFWGSK